jgi:cell division protein FtsZ
MWSDMNEVPRDDAPPQATEEVRALPMRAKRGDAPATRYTQTVMFEDEIREMQQEVDRREAAYAPPQPQSTPDDMHRVTPPAPRAETPEGPAGRSEPAAVDGADLRAAEREAEEQRKSLRQAEQRRETRKMATRAYMDGLPPIKVVGVGGGGCNAVNRMIEEHIPGVQFVAVNTDAQVLALSSADVKMRIGDKLTKGLGVGGDPNRGERAAEESEDDLLESLRGAEMVFVTAGMGGGTGTGASPIVAKVAKDAGALTIGVVTKPFGFEGKKRRVAAEEGIQRLQEQVDTLIVIPNDRLLQICDEKVTMEEAFRVADDILLQGIRGISEIITLPGEINLDFADVRKIMSEAGPALMAIGRASGADRAEEAARKAIESPLLDVAIDGARGVLFNITGSKNLGLHEINAAAQVIADVVDEDAEIIFGTTVNPQMGDEVQITLIATGFTRLHAVDRIPDEYRKAVGDDVVSIREPAEPPSMDKMEAEAEADPMNRELPAFLRRRITAR